jgi:hypothetical protein
VSFVLAFSIFVLVGRLVSHWIEFEGGLDMFSPLYRMFGVYDSEGTVDVVAGIFFILSFAIAFSFVVLAEPMVRCALNKPVSNPVALVAVGIALILALPVLIPLAFALLYLDERRLRAAAKRAACPTCGRTLGIEALQQADEYWREYNAELQRIHPGRINRRAPRNVHAICLHCRTALCFCEDLGTFNRTEAWDAGGYLRFISKLGDHRDADASDEAEALGGEGESRLAPQSRTCQNVSS